MFKSCRLAVASVAVGVAVTTLVPAPAYAATLAADRTIADVRIIAHRGAHFVYGEDTVESQVEAIRLGATCAETDLRISRDGHFVQMHDTTVDRTTDGSGPIHEMTLRQIRMLRTIVGNNAVPTLSDSLQALRKIGHGCLQVEITGFYWSRAKVAQMWDLIALHGMQDRVVAFSGNTTYLRHVRDAAPAMETIWKVTGDPSTEEALRNSVDAIVPHGEYLTADVVDEMHAIGVQVFVPIADTPRSWQRMYAIGADGLMTNDTAAFLQWYGAGGPQGRAPLVGG
jgi:glycerophosphoryl diester phosphodiesterase